MNSKSLIVEFLDYINKTGLKLIRYHKQKFDEIINIHNRIEKKDPL